MTSEESGRAAEPPDRLMRLVYEVPSEAEAAGEVQESEGEVQEAEGEAQEEGEEEIAALEAALARRPRALERWLRERAPPGLVTRVHAVTAPVAVAAPTTPDLFHMWLATSPLQRQRSRSPGGAAGAAGAGGAAGAAGAPLDEAELFMELIRDVANELDIDVLCHKILVNVCLLTAADRGSLFLARGVPPRPRYLQAKLFDVTRDTELGEALHLARSQEIRIEFGVGVAGLAAETKSPINIKNAYEDPRFNSDIDARTGYKTELILCMPICNYEGDVIGVAQIINKTDGSSEFSARDVDVFRRYLTFCGIGIQNAQLFETSVLEYRRNQILLSLARGIFEEQSNLECLVTKIMTQARELLKCERCAVFIIDTDHCEASHLERIGQRPGAGGRGGRGGPLALSPPPPARFTWLFELGARHSRKTLAPQHDTGSTLACIALEVAQNNKALNIADVATWRRRLAAPAPEEDDARDARTMLCMPIVNANKDVIGVAQLINKENSAQFTESDVSLLEAFAIFCGLGIHNTQMYENACKLMAKQKVALECLSYHATASVEDTLRLRRDEIQSAECFNLYSFTFHDQKLSDDDTCRATLRMFLECNLVEQFHIPYEVLCRWTLSVKKNYRPVKYHNWRHALNVAQTMFAMLKTGKMERLMTDLEILGLLVACLCHDLDHRGTTNAFQIKTESPLAVLYSTSTMEHHHFDQCVMILNSESNNIFQALSPCDYRSVMRVVEMAILSTDLAVYFKKKSRFQEVLNDGEFDWQGPEKKELLCGMMMTACDVSAIAKPWEVQHRIAKLVADEFFDQGDLERLQLNQQPVAMMDRERKDELPRMQVDFIKVICEPLYRTLAEAFPWVAPLHLGTLDNQSRWEDLAEKVDMGLTWIDHDTIERPIEEISASTELMKDVELVVTTLREKAPEGAGGGAAGAAGGGRPYRPQSSLRRGKSGAFNRLTRNKLTRSLYESAPSSREEKAVAAAAGAAGAERESTNNNTPAADAPPPAHAHKSKAEEAAAGAAGGAGAGAGDSKPRARLCHLL